MRGWTLTRQVTRQAGDGAWDLRCDPLISPALAIGLRAGLGLDIAATPYALPAALPGSRRRRALARQAMRALATVSRPGRVRVAAVAAGKLSLALASLPTAELRGAGVGLMPFPGLDHGNGLLLALRRGLPLLRTYGPALAGMETGVQAGSRKGAVGVSLPARLGVESEEALDRALTLLVRRVLEETAPELEQAVAALAAMQDAGSLRAVLLPSAAYGASRLLIEWAHQRELRVGAMQHGIYSFREFDGGDRRTDTIMGWGPGTAEQIAGWPRPWPSVHAVGVPGLIAGVSVRRSCAAVGSLPRRILVATSSAVEAPLVPVALCDTFIHTIAPGLHRLAAAGAEVELRPHPGEEPERYRRLLRSHCLNVRVVPDGTFSAAIARADILIAAASSVAFEAAALGVPALLWLGPAPRWVREKHLVAPWSQSHPGMFTHAEDFTGLVECLIGRPAEGLRVAHRLSRRLAHYAQPFDAALFAAGLRELGS